MKRFWMLLGMGFLLCLGGCAQRVEKEPVVVTEEKTAVEPLEVPEKEEAVDSQQESKSMNDELEKITRLKDAPDQLYRTERKTDKGEEIQRVWKLRKCDGGFGFYYPVYDKEEQAWDMGEDSDNIYFGKELEYRNQTGLQMTFMCLEGSDLDYARKLIGGGIDLLTDGQGEDMLVREFNDDRLSEECKVGVHDYPAIKTPKLLTPVYPAAAEMGVEPQGEVEMQYYFFEGPEGLIQLRIYAPSQGAEQAWTDVENMLSTLIVEDSSVYEDYHCAVSVNARDKELVFTDKDELCTLYRMCVKRGDYETVMKISKNITPQTEGKEAWESMECHLSHPGTYMEGTDRAVMAVFIIADNPGLTKLPDYHDGEQQIVRYLYLIKEENFWYIDGPLHNELPGEDWWNGENVRWNVMDFGLSDSPETGKILCSEDEMTEFLWSWENEIVQGNIQGKESVLVQ